MWSSYLNPNCLFQNSFGTYIQLILSSNKQALPKPQLLTRSISLISEAIDTGSLSRIAKPKHIFRESRSEFWLYSIYMGGGVFAKTWFGLNELMLNLYFHSYIIPFS